MLVRHRQQCYGVWFSDGPGRQPKGLVAGEDFRLDFEAPGRFFCGDLPPRLLDLMRISMATYAVDRLSRRGASESRSWRRDLTVRVEVLDPEFWMSREILDRLQEAVEFVSGDFWDFEFTKGRSSYEGTSPLLTRAFASESPLVCLYSGGLDSAAGLARRLQDCADRPVLPITVKHQPRQQVLIGGQFDRLRNQFGARIEPLVVKAAIIRPVGSRWRKEESSQRARSFLFATAGAVAAVLSGSGSVEVYESGIGAINVPLMAGMLGTKATRGCHPEFLRRMSRLASLVAGRDVSFRLPFLDRTKGEIVRGLKRAGLADLARGTVSCVRYPTGHRSYQQCGYCPACLFRRQAMLVAGIRERRGTYTFDLFGPAERVNRIRPERLDSLRAFLMQAASLAAVQTTGRLPEPVDRHLRDTQILGPGDSAEPIIGLLSRNSDEWRLIAEAGRLKGYHWARLLDRNLVGQGVSHAPA